MNEVKKKKKTGRMEPTINADIIDELEPVRALTLAEKAYRRLEEMIVTLRLAPGEVLSEAELAKKMKIGRTPIREALQRLSREGLVSILPWRGVLVSEINIKTQMQLLEVRREVEGLMARLAAVRATDEERSCFYTLAEALDQAAAEKDAILFIQLDRQLNMLWSRAARNDFIAKSMSLMQGLSRRFWYVHCSQVADLPLVARLHAKVARTIGNGAAEEAEQASNTLNEYVELCTRTAIDTTQSSLPVSFPGVRV
jgi:DNA-binding GntR family transcriptional regulator